jgi:Ca2+-binding EF-hand superfamily protein
LEPPKPENPTRENRLTSPKNIVFLYLEQKLTELELTMKEAIGKFDKESKGYLLYPEFERLIHSLGVKLNPAQISEVIRGVDADGDGFIVLDVSVVSMSVLVCVYTSAICRSWRRV